MPPANMTVQEQEEDKLASEYSLWLPRTVVKRHRTKATVIWVILISTFIGYISFIVYDTVDSRRDPAASFQLKREAYTFPDLAICINAYEGCLADNTADCLGTADVQMIDQFGFLNDPEEFNEAENEAVGAIESNFTCKVLPASDLVLNQTGIDNQDITYLFARFAMIWSDDPNDEYDPEVYAFNWQFVTLFFVDVDDGVEGVGTEIADAKLPYERLTPIFNTTMIGTSNHVVLDLLEFHPISAATGRKGEPERTYTQATTSGKFNWFWNGDTSEEPVAVLLFDLFIPKFEYTRIVEVDPVDAWAIIGAIGGVWQFVVIAFGMFFVFSEKQDPDKKMRNFRKTVVKPAAAVRRLSSVSSRGSIITTSPEDVVVDASDEDLPDEWVKKRNQNGSFYYFNALTGATQSNSPHGGTAGADTRPRGIASVFKRSFRRGSSAGSGTDDGEFSGVNLPPGWRERQDGAGKTYYVNTVLKTTQWERPTQRAPSHGSSGVQAVYAPRENVPSYQSMVSGGGGAGSSSLPPGWRLRTAEDGKTYYENTVTKVTQVERRAVKSKHACGGVTGGIATTPSPFTEEASRVRSFLHL